MALYFKNVLKNPKNKWVDNQIFYGKLIFANIPAAMVTIGVSQYFGLGRLDLGMFLGSYIVLYTTIFLGFGLKIEQAFELASNWIYSKIPRKLRATEEAQRYINNQIQFKKIMFNVYEETYGAIVGSIKSLFAMMDSVTEGSRAMLRLMFGGETMTTYLVQGLNAFKETFKIVPGVETVAEFFKNLFSNRYEAFERFPERVFTEAGMPVPDLTEPRYAEPAKAGFAKFVAVIIGLGSTVGTFAGIPYGASSYYHHKIRKKIQQKGREYLKSKNNQSLSCRNLFVK